MFSFEMASFLVKIEAFILLFLYFDSYTFAIPVFVMLPLDTVNIDGTLKNETELRLDLEKIASGGVAGIMTDVWWGIAEQNPKQYNWSPYLKIAEICKQNDLKMTATMSFHKCGTNVGDTCYIPLPNWVLSVGKSNRNIWYIDSQNSTDDEYLSLSVDTLPLFSGRTATDIYADFMRDFSSVFSSYLGNTVTEVQVGLGPAGELRFPSYQIQDNKWQYCGIGEYPSEKN